MTITHGMDDDFLFLKKINHELPNEDWKSGARSYIAHYIDLYGSEAVERLSFSKPLMAITPEDPTGSLISSYSYLYNFTNAIKLLDLPRGARILDVACGGGWVSHWLARLGYNSYGIDISEEFIDLARKRVERDPDMGRDAGTVRFDVLDIEETQFDPEFLGYFDAIILESCLHHFIDPVAAMRNITYALKDSGVVLIIEGENRRGPINPVYMDVMRQTRTLERPYFRNDLISILQRSGLSEVSFLATIEGYISQHDPRLSALTAIAHEVLNGRNTCVCAKNIDAITRIVPSYLRTEYRNTPEYSSADVGIPVVEQNENKNTARSDFKIKIRGFFQKMISKI